MQKKGVTFYLARPIEKLDLTDWESQKSDSAEVLNKAQARENI